MRGYQQYQQLEARGYPYKSLACVYIGVLGYQVPPPPPPPTAAQQVEYPHSPYRLPPENLPPRDQVVLTVPCARNPMARKRLGGYHPPEIRRYQRVPGTRERGISPRRVMNHPCPEPRPTDTAQVQGVVATVPC